MSSKDLQLSFTVEASPEEVFNALTHVHDWWGGGIKGSSQKKGDSFVYRHKDLHVSKQTVSAFEANKRIVWLVSQSELSFVKDKSEWEGTEVEFLVEKQGKQTKVILIHHGLKPKLECFEACSGGWEHYFCESLKNLIVSGKGNPDPKAYSVA